MNLNKSFHKSFKERITSIIVHTLKIDSFSRSSALILHKEFYETCLNARRIVVGIDFGIKYTNVAFELSSDVDARWMSLEEMTSEKIVVIRN